MTLTIELPETVTRELDDRRISSQQIRAFVIEAIEAWLRLQPDESETATVAEPSRFGASAVPFVEKLVSENRALFQQLAQQI